MGRGPGRCGRAVRAACDGRLVALADAPDAPPLIVAVGSERARVHLLCSVAHDELGELVGELSVNNVCILQVAVQRLVATSPEATAVIRGPDGQGVVFRDYLARLLETGELP